MKALLFPLSGLCCTFAPLRAVDLCDASDVAARLATADARTKATVLVFLSHDCPISNALAPELNHIAEKYGTLGVAFYFVYAERDLADADAVRHSHDYALDARVTVDRAGVLAARARARVTPEAAVFSRAGEVVYHGRINDLFAALGQRRAEPTTHDLRDALDAVLVGKAPPLATTPPIGCFISGKP